MFKIGFIDYFLDEWHANQYPGWIEKATQGEMKVTHAYGMIDSPRGGLTTDQWCEKNNVQRCDTLAELCEKSDYILVLAPSNPETHLRYASEVLKYGKRTYIDKTFAPDLATAEKIFEIGKKTLAFFEII